ncbi:MAG: exo-alpha-sialidase [Candidatus Eisenbacteria bacterium]
MPGELRATGGGPWAPARRGGRLQGLGIVGPDARMNSPLGSPANNGESEVSVAASGSRLIAAWNDGNTFAVQPGFVGYGYSLDGGATWADGGSLPVAGVSDIYYGDPVLAADPAGTWYIADLYRPLPGDNSISVNAGVFTGPVPVWGPPVVVAAGLGNALDKPWIAVDAIDGTVYLAWVNFQFGGQTIEFSRSLDHGVTWSPRTVLTSIGESGPMSPRLAVGPDHELHLAYYETSLLDGQEYLRLRTSADHGVTWSAVRTIGGRPFANNFYSGPAGANRERVVALVSLAVDGSSGPQRGSLHAVWHEMVDLGADALGTSGVVNALEPDGTLPTAIPFTPGQSLRGSLSSTTDQDWWAFSGTAGQTLVAQLTPQASACNGFLRMFAGGGATANRCAFSHFGNGVGVVVFTLPSTGTYALRVLNWDGVPADTGSYRIDTAWHSVTAADHARDHRDVMYSRSSDGGVIWTTPVVVGDAPANYDETFPEVAVNNAGQVYVMWYDHREDVANGILTTMRARVSPDGGATWLASERVDSAAPVNWNLVNSNMFPNMGDYSQLVAAGAQVHAVWADGRNGTPDAYHAVLEGLTLDAPGHGTGSFTLRAGARARGRAVVSWSGGADAAVTLELYDVAGRRLARVQPAAGAAQAELGEGLGAGVYFVRARSGGLTADVRVAVLP